MHMEVKADLSANVWKVLVAPGQKVDADDIVIILECMKMEVPILAQSTGIVMEVFVREGDAVEEGSTLVVLKFD